MTGTLPYKKKSSQVCGLFQASRPRPFFIILFCFFFQLDPSQLDLY
jgi:hypothetical protein